MGREIKWESNGGIKRGHSTFHVKHNVPFSDPNVPFSDPQNWNQTTGPACFKTFVTLARASPAIQSSRHSLSDAMRFIWPVQTSVTEAVAFWLIRPYPNQSQFITQRVMATLYSTRCSPAGQDKSSHNNNHRRNQMEIKWGHSTFQVKHNVP